MSAALNAETGDAKPLASHRARCVVCGTSFIARRSTALTCSGKCRTRRYRMLNTFTPEFPPGPFDLIYADPPWSFEVYSAKGKQRSADRHYNRMDIEAICRRPVEKIAAPDSVLVMWFTDERMPEALRVMDAWGFIFKTIALTWVKTTKDGSRPRMSLGYHTRKCSEKALLAVRGNGLRRVDMGVPDTILAPRREHSRKPDESLERLYGDVRRIELFSRRTRPGWTS